ncbi:recombinase family protein [Paenarthrobacter sp. 22069]|uniref:recombinase family protein n=1 Tax=Paenarthrobacter sp. 22069 TaxID=3453864 RepID=UPI003F835121
MTTSAVYLRISKDKALGTDDEGHAVERQRKGIHKMLKAKGWEIGPEYLENDTSASGKVPRPEYQRMLDDYAAGDFDAISAWKLDRLWRVPKELEHIIALVEQTALMVATVDGDLDLTTSQGRTMARVLTAFAQDELDKRSDRQKARFAQDREAGKDHWRGRRPFGLTLEGKEVSEEADAIRAVAESVLDGGTISAGADYLNKRGIKTTFGGEWGRQPLRRTLLHPRLAGLREHNGELIEGKWDAVLERDTWEAIVAKLNTPGRPKPKKTDREYLLSGLITCAQCGGKAYGIPTRKKLSSGVIKLAYVYRCANTHVSKSLVPTDNLVILKTLEALLSTDYEEVEADKDALKALREARAHELKDWSDWQQEAADEGLRPSEIRPARERHEARLRDIEHRIAELEKVSLVRMPTLEELAESTADDNGQIALVFDWDALSLEKRRRLITTVWESITIYGQKKGARWDDSTVKFVGRKVS